MKKPSLSHACTKVRETLASPLHLMTLMIFCTVILYCTGSAYISLLRYQHHIPENHKNSPPGCDIFDGKWVHDMDLPAYEEWECPYLEAQTTCVAHGRPDKEFRYWRWQPHQCSLPRFNASMMLEALRGKRMMFVGDSVNRGQYISMVCLLQLDIPPHAKSMEVLGSLTVFRAKEYNATVEFYWAPFLLESNADDPFHHRVGGRIIHSGSVKHHGHYWKQADILLFNTYIWWISGLQLLRRGSFGDEVLKDVVKIEIEDGYRMAMQSFIQWVEENIKPKGKRVFFISMSPTHQRSHKWGGSRGGNCYNETVMIEDHTFFGADKTLMQITLEELEKSRVPITFLNITQLSSVRKDAHVSIYKQQWKRLTKQELAKLISYADCIHWCLPGLPDIWNELLFAELLYL